MGGVCIKNPLVLRLCRSGGPQAYVYNSDWTTLSLVEIILRTGAMLDQKEHSDCDL